MAIIKTDIGRNPCDLTLLEHWNDIADVLTRAGVGLRCEKAYQAFMIIAETSRILNNHPEYDPKPEAEKLAAVARDYAAQVIVSENKAKTVLETAHDISFTPTDKNKVN